jgi:hypothetical protein
MTTASGLGTGRENVAASPSWAGVLSRLAQEPYGDPPIGTYREEREDGTPVPAAFGDVDTGDWIAIGGLWHKITRSFRVDDVVTIHTGELGPILSGPWGAPVYLAHVCCVLPAKRCP